MNWYYAEQGAQKGPVEDREFQRLVETGRVTAQTLVWHDGLADWQPYAKVSGTPVAAPSSGAAACARCGRTFEAAQLLRYGDQNVCGECKGAFFQSLQEGVAQPNTLVYGGFWVRFAAKFLDGLILGVVGMLLQFAIIFLLFGGSMVANPTANPSAIASRTIATMIVSYSVGLLVGVTYVVCFVGRYGATPGKMACGLKIVRPDGGRVSYGQAAGRYFSEILSALIFYIGYLMVAFDDEKRALHDRICATRVIRVR
jgi:uncharacterized RDD family membrane protein YckC